MAPAPANNSDKRSAKTPVKSNKAAKVVKSCEKLDPAKKIKDEDSGIRQTTRRSSFGRVSKVLHPNFKGTSSDVRDDVKIGVYGGVYRGKSACSNAPKSAMG